MIANTIPDNGGYVAAAYLVFLALVLIYVAIMATKLARLEKDLTELNELAKNEPESKSANTPKATAEAK